MTKKIKHKTKQAVAKRFKRTATGKIKRSHTSRGHLLGGKSRKRKRHLRKSVMLSSANISHISSSLPQ
ncbi:MAG TPA: 50S ribosomal protein L35 [Kiritimatiellia bacterium]|nr:50S ribosomal protein L35 [Kiritimatiellia bacterium]